MKIEEALKTEQYDVCVYATYNDDEPNEPEYNTNVVVFTWEVNGDLVITQGFHSYSRQDCFYAIEYGISIYSRNRAKEEKEDGDWCLINRFDYTPYEEIVVLEGIIPKGSCYYKNDNGEMVSDRIVLNGVLADDEQ